MTSSANSVVTLSSIKTLSSAVKKTLMIKKRKMLNKSKLQSHPTLDPLQAWMNHSTWPKNSKSITLSKTGLKMKKVLKLYRKYKRQRK